VSGAEISVVRMADDRDRETIYRMRHEVYAAELGQHSPNAAGRLTDALDAFNHYIVIADGERIVGFVSITPPGGPSYSIDKYFKRTELPFAVDDKLYEIRLLTVPQSSRSRLLASALMYAAFRWIEARGGTHIAAIGRKEIRSIHLRVGLKPTGQDVQSGAVTYGLLHGTMAEIHAALPGVRPILDRVQAEMSWQIGVAYDTPTACYHGGKFFEAVGDEFQTLERLDTIIAADVLDAWFPPSPKAVAALEKNLPQLLRTSPPTGCEGLVRTIARVRGVQSENILPGAGSSDLIFLALRHWLTAASRVLILDPTYGEYAHVLERVIRCRVNRLPLLRGENYRVDLSRLNQALTGGYDLVVLVNPNNPTGQHIPRAELEAALKKVSPATRVWVDETYIEYAGSGESLEQFAARSENVIVCKSMSKVYALSGARVAYLGAGPAHAAVGREPAEPGGCRRGVAGRGILCRAPSRDARPAHGTGCGIAEAELARHSRHGEFSPVPSARNRPRRRHGDCPLPRTRTIPARCRQAGHRPRRPRAPHCRERRRHQPAHD